MGSKTTPAPEVAAAKAATEQVTEKAAEQAKEGLSTAGVGTAVQEEALAAATQEAANQEASGSGKLYTVASPIKHDGKDLMAGDQIRLPEATAHRLAGYLKD